MRGPASDRAPVLHDPAATLPGPLHRRRTAGPDAVRRAIAPPTPAAARRAERAAKTVRALGRRARAAGRAGAGLRSRALAVAIVVGRLVPERRRAGRGGHRG